MATKTRWTSLEYMHIADYLFKKHGPHKNLSGIMPSDVDFAQKAVIEPGRQRTKTSLTACMKQVRRELNIHFYNLLNHHGGGGEQLWPPAVGPQPVQSSDPVREALSTLISELLPANSSLEPALLAISDVAAQVGRLSNLVQELSAKLAVTHDDVRVTKQLVDSLRQKPAAVDLPVEGDLRTPKILVVGPLNSQRPFIEQAINGAARLSFIESGELSGSAFSGYDAAVLWTKFCQHAHQILIKKHIPTILYANGGLDSIKDQIHAYLSNKH